ncbi:MAG: hypothetical protein LWX83_04335 [Anaerolineae bacterium]|nr:hypothetical protein [Anaerolineae bacterium]
MTDNIHCHIRVKGHLGQQWSQWFDGLTINTLQDDETTISGTLPDQAAFFGVLAHIRDLGMRVVMLDCKQEDYDPPGWNQTV